MITPALNNCTCICHRQEGVTHVVACCRPDYKDEYPNWPYPKLPDDEKPKKKKKK